MSSEELKSAISSCVQSFNALNNEIEDALSFLYREEETIMKGIRSEAAAGNHTYAEEVRARLEDWRCSLEQNFFRIRMEAAQGMSDQVVPPSLLQKKQELSYLIQRLLDEIERIQAA